MIYVSVLCHTQGNSSNISLTEIFYISLIWQMLISKDLPCLHSMYFTFLSVDWSHFILGVYNYCDKDNIRIVFILYCKTLLLLFRWDKGTVRHTFGSMCRFKERVNSVIIDVITEMYYIFHINFFKKYK